MAEKKNSLIELTAYRQEALALISKLDGELNDSLEEYLDQVTRDLKFKVDSYSFQLDEFKSQAEYFKALAKDFQAKAKACENAGERLKDRIKQVLLEGGGKELSGNIHSFKLARSAPKLVIIDEVLSRDLRMLVVTPTVEVPDKQRIKEKLDKGEYVPGAYYEPVFSLRTGVAKLTKGKS